jgi:hypothetical protein
MKLEHATMGNLLSNEFTEQDIAFLVGAADRRLLDRIDVIKGDAAFVESIIENKALDLLERILLMSTDSLLVTVSPRLLFEVLLRAARKEMATRTYTLERTAREKIPVFDAAEALAFIKDDAVLRYLASMLASFTHIRSYTWPVRVRKGIWRRYRFNDMDIDSLLRFCQTVDEERRFELYKRIGDLCLFTLGVFPEHAGPVVRYASSGSHPSGRRLLSAEDYEAEGRRFYRLAAQHPDSRAAGLDRILLRLHEDFHLATKPLSHISERYLQFRRSTVFPAA